MNLIQLASSLINLLSLRIFQAIGIKHQANNSSGALAHRFDGKESKLGVKPI
jgi:hypothetical protein